MKILVSNRYWYQKRLTADFIPKLNHPIELKINPIELSNSIELNKPKIKAE